jgi:hypothetical protein
MIGLLSLFAVTAVAADISGKWTNERPGRDGGAPMVTTYTFKVAGGVLTGTITSQRGDQEISEGKVSGDDVSFAVVRTFNDQTMKTIYKGKVAGNEMKLMPEFQAPPGGGGAPGGAGARGGGGAGRGPQELILKRAS